MANTENFQTLDDKAIRKRKKYEGQNLVSCLILTINSSIQYYPKEKALDSAKRIDD